MPRLRVPSIGGGRKVMRTPGLGGGSISCACAGASRSNRNIQHPTSNIQHPMAELPCRIFSARGPRPLDVGRWMLGVGCWLPPLRIVAPVELRENVVAPFAVREERFVDVL